MASFLYNLAVVEGITPLGLQPGKFGDRFVSITRGPQAIFVGVAASDDAIVPLETGAIWFPAAPPRITSPTDKPVILHFHPGGYVMGDVRDLRR